MNWKNWLRKWPDTGGYFWEWRPGFPKPYIVLFPEPNPKFQKEIEKEPPINYYMPVKYPELPVIKSIPYDYRREMESNKSAVKRAKAKAKRTLKP